MFTLPCDGPFGCFDYYGSHVICIDEAKNSIIKSDLHGKKIERFSIPSILGNEFFCWIKIYCVEGKFILGLLKSHIDKSFNLVTVRLNHEDKCCTVVRNIETGISSNGLKVEAHRSMSQFVFSICNTRHIIRKPKRQMSDRKSFMKQLKEDSEKNGNEKPIEKNTDNQKYEIKLNIQSVDDTSVESTSDKYEREESNIAKKNNIMESVLLLVKTESSGEIIPTILSTGRRRYGIKVHRTRSLREFRRTFSTKVMTKWVTSSTSESSSEPFLWGNNCCALSKDDVSFFYLTHAILNPKQGWISSLMHKLSHRFRRHSPLTEPLQYKIKGIGPGPNLLWSNIEILQGAPTFLAMNKETRKITRYQLLRYSNVSYEWKRSSLDIEGPEETVKLMFRSNTEQLNSLEYTIRFQLKESKGGSIFYNVSVPKIVVYTENDDIY